MQPKDTEERRRAIDRVNRAYADEDYDRYERLIERYCHRFGFDGDYGLFEDACTDARIFGHGIVAENGKVGTDEMIAGWESALERDEWPSGWVNVGEIVEGKLPKAAPDTVTLSLKVPAAMKRALEKEAKAEGKSTGTTIEHYLGDAEEFYPDEHPQILEREVGYIFPLMEVEPTICIELKNEEDEG